ncbi:MAG: hypothetical protein Q9M20_05905 [Mariprofundaceae bacterium]|nr:hypothetical protein [Mariprofundaceae bacterium]
MSEAQNLHEYLVHCCEEYDFMGCVVADGDGLMLAMSGENMHDEFIAHLSGWLSSGSNISELGGLGSMACCCMVPRNKNGVMLAWSIERDHEQHLYFAALTKRIPPKIVNALDTMAEQVKRFVNLP